jgi:hypothetical protein
VNQSFDLGWGTGFYNAIIRCWVPRQIVGEDFKRGLLLHQERDYPRYSWDIPYGSNPTGIANAFAELWFFGAFFYFLLGMGYRRLWYWANLGGIRAQIAYIVLAPLALSTVVGNLVLLPSDLLYYVVFLGPVLVFAGRTRFHQNKRRPN